ncbi:MAG: hypothetical protein R3F11_04410 [Verrucomicrobiales bacterium]
MRDDRQNPADLGVEKVVRLAGLKGSSGEPLPDRADRLRAARRKV